LLVNPGNATSATIYGKLNFNFIRDIAPVAGIIRAPLVIEVNPSIPNATSSGTVLAARANPGKVNFASPGNGSTNHITGELFKMMTDINMVHVPYRGSAPGLTDLLGGQVQVMFDNLLSSIEYVRAGQLRALAVTTTTRSPALPDVPRPQKYYETERTEPAYKTWRAIRTALEKSRILFLEEDDAGGYGVRLKKTRGTK
jgi:tripartite-type tricarboxylate transporter receptor subunit TctC